MVEWTKQLLFFGGPVRLTSGDSTLGLGWQVTKERLQTLVRSYVDLAAKDIPDSFWPNCRWAGTGGCPTKKSTRFLRP